MSTERSSSCPENHRSVGAIGSFSDMSQSFERIAYARDVLEITRELKGLLQQPSRILERPPAQLQVSEGLQREPEPGRVPRIAMKSRAFLE